MVPTIAREHIMECSQLDFRTAILNADGSDRQSRSGIKEFRDKIICTGNETYQETVRYVPKRHDPDNWWNTTDKSTW